MNPFQMFFERLSQLATAGPLAVPIWLAGLFLLLSFLRGPLVKVIFRAFKAADSETEAALRQKTDVPLQLLFLLLALTPFTFLVAMPLGPVLVLICHFATIALLFHIIIQIIDLSIFSWYAPRKQANISRVVRIAVLCMLYLVALMLVLNWALGVSVLPLIATSTVLTAAIGLSLQDTMKNAFAGLNMSLEKSFEEGDWVSFRLDATEKWYGQIAEIGWRTTKIKTLNNNYAVIPNSKFTTNELINFNRPSQVHARTVEIPVLLQADPTNIRTTLERSAAACSGVLDDPPPSAVPLSITGEHVVYQLRFWMVDIAQREAVTGDVIERSWRELKELGALKQ